MKKLNNAEIAAFTKKILSETKKVIKYDFADELKAIEKFKKTKDFEVLNRYHKAVCSARIIKSILKSSKSKAEVEIYNRNDAPEKEVRLFGEKIELVADYLMVPERTEAEVRDLVVLAQIDAKDLKSLVASVKRQL